MTKLLLGQFSEIHFPSISSRETNASVSWWNIIIAHMCIALPGPDTVQTALQIQINWFTLYPGPGKQTPSLSPFSQWSWAQKRQVLCLCLAVSEGRWKPEWKQRIIKGLESLAVRALAAFTECSQWSVTPVEGNFTWPQTDTQCTDRHAGKIPMLIKINKSTNIFFKE